MAAREGGVEGTEAVAGADINMGGCITQDGMAGAAVGVEGFCLTARESFLTRSLKLRELRAESSTLALGCCFILTL